MSQHQKIIELCADKDWHCQSAFWLISKSPHKRRSDIEKHLTAAANKNYDYRFHARDCIHEIAAGMKDYRLEITLKVSAPKKVSIPQPLFQLAPKNNSEIWARH